MAWLADLSPCSDPGEYGALVLAVGWIDHLHEYTRGPVSSRLVGQLAQLLEDPWQPRQTLGWHDCTLCRLSRGPRTFEYEGRVVKLGVNNLFVPAPEEQRLYIAPSSILHAMDAHEYAPPEEFVRAVLRCPPMRSTRYMVALSSVAPPWLVEAGPLRPAAYKECEVDQRDHAKMKDQRGTDKCLGHDDYRMDAEKLRSEKVKKGECKCPSGNNC